MFFDAIEGDAQELLEKTPGVIETQTLRSIDMRYVGQTHEVTVPIRSRTRRVTELNLNKTIQDFHELHEQLYSFKRPEQTVEVLNVRSDLVGFRDTIKYRSTPFESEDPAAAFKGKRRVGFDQLGFVETNVYDGTLLQPGNLIAGPAIIEEPETTIVVYPQQEAMLDHYQTYIIESFES